jgi:hypothetical protein
MESTNENFNLHATLASVANAMVAVVCHMLFMWALHGLALSVLVALIGFILYKREHRFGIAMLTVAKRTAIFCACVCLPGALYLAMHGRLPDAGVFNFNSFGFIGFWSLIYLHLCAEEINHRQSKKNAAMTKIERAMSDDLPVKN